MKTLLNMATAQVPLPANQLGYLLGWLRHLTFLGFPGYAQRPIKNFDLFPSPVCHQLPQVDLKDGETSTRDNKPVMRRSRVNKKARKSMQITAPNTEDMCFFLFFLILVVKIFIEDYGFSCL